MLGRGRRALGRVVGTAQAREKFIPWHSDIESHAPEGGFVSVWIGIEHTSRESSLQLIGGSHRLGLSVQEARADIGACGRDQATRETLLELAHVSDDPQAPRSSSPT